MLNIPDLPVRVSVIMPMKNAKAFVARAIGSVLSQEGISLELLVIDDGSDDGSVELVRKIEDPRVRLISNPGSGIASAFNAGLAAARGEYIARCDADDLFPSERLQEQAVWLSHHPEFAAICGAFVMMSPRGAILCDLAQTGVDEEITEELQNGTIRTHGCTYLTRADVLRRLQGCRPFFQTGEDVDLQLRLGDTSRIWYQSTRRYYYRLHASSITHRVSRTRTRYYDSCARRFQLQRQAVGKDDLQTGAEPPGFKEINPAAPSVNRQIQNILLGHAWHHHTSGRKLQSVMVGVRAGLFKPQHLRTWRSIAALVIKRAGSVPDTEDSGAHSQIDGRQIKTAETKPT